VCLKEGVDAEAEALAIIAAAAEGSVRDGLSILDQAIAHADLDGEGQVRAATVRDMLGLSDKSVQRNLFAAVLEGRGSDLLEVVAHQFALGVEPIAIVRGLMDLTHRVGVAQVSGTAADAHSAEERETIEGWAKGLRPGQLHRLWQLLLKGFEEVRSAPDPLVALQMALLRIMHAADMPDPGSLVRKLEEIASRAPAITTGEGGHAAPAPSAVAAPRWEALVDEVEHAGQIVLANTLRMQVRVVELSAGHLRYAQPPGFSADISNTIKAGLADATGERWQVERVIGAAAEGAMPTLVERAETQKAADSDAVRRSPLVEATLAAFPGAELIDDDRPAAIGGGARSNWRR